MGGLDPAKLLVILVLALVLLGPERLPRAARQVGAFWRDLTKMRERLEQEVREALPDIDLPEIPNLRRASVTGYLTSMMQDSSASATSTDGTVETTTEDGVGELPPLRRRPGGAVSYADEGVLGAGGTGIPAGWQSRGAEVAGYASGSLFSNLPGGQPEAILSAEARLDLDDPSWN